MTYQAKNVRSGLAALAAALALSSNPLAAQETTAPVDPVIEAPDPAPAADPLAPEPAASEPEAAEPAASKAAPAEMAAPATTRRAPAPTRTRAANRVSGQAARSAAPAITAQTSDTAAETMPPPPAVAVGEPVAPTAAEPVATSEPFADDSLAIAAAAGLGLLALGGIGLAIQRRRRRRDEMKHFDANQQYLAEHPVAPMPGADEPAFARGRRSATAASDPAEAVRADAPRTRLPSGFDLSRFGPHVRAAYLGPTPDNQSLSLKHRLRRAAAMDQRTRLEADRRRPAERSAARPEPAKQPGWNSNGMGIMFRRAGIRQQPKPAYRH